MSNILRKLSLFGGIGSSRNEDLVLATVFGCVLAIMLCPLPETALDLCLGANVAIATLILVSVLLSERPIQLSSFPAVLLITTFSRLALNVSSTRLILSTGSAGKVISAFSNLVVGLVIFLVVTAVQFIVVAKGAERVAEVAARFTLDAMPGKQMSIDADFRAGTIDEEEAQARRLELNRESQFYGAMDGAMKFVKGDAVAGILIVLLNLIAGLAIGKTRFGYSFSEAVDIYAPLTVGDGLVSQIPALLITLAAGIMTTRVGSGKKHGQNLGQHLRSELFENERSSLLVGVLLLGFALVPSLPFFVFASIGTAMLTLSAYLFVQKRPGYQEESQPFRGDQAAEFQDEMHKKIRQARAQEALLDRMAPAVAPLSIEIGSTLSRSLHFEKQGYRDERTELIGVMLPQIRDAMFLETGIRFPPAHVRPFAQNVNEDAFRISVKDVPFLERPLPDDTVYAIEKPIRLAQIGIRTHSELRHPLDGRRGCLIPSADQQVAQAAGVSVWSHSGVVALFLGRAMRQNTGKFLGVQETSDLLQRLDGLCGALIRETVPKVVSIVQLSDILRRLAEERVSIRDLKAILENLSENAGHESDPVVLTEYVRQALSDQLAYTYAKLSNKLSVLLLSSEIEDAVRTAVVRRSGVSYLAMEPEIRREITEAVAKASAPCREVGVQAIILTDSSIRRFVHKLLLSDIDDTVVLSYQELPPHLTIQPLGRVEIGRTKSMASALGVTQSSAEPARAKAVI